MAAKVIHFKKNGSLAPQKFVADDGGNNISAVLSSPCSAATIFPPFYRHRAARKQYFCLFIVTAQRGNNIFAFYRHRAARKPDFCHFIVTVRRGNDISAVSVLAVLLQTHSRTVLTLAGQLRAFRNVARTARGWRRASCRGENEKQSSEIE